MSADWVCSACHSVNLASARRCYRCHAPMGQTAPEAPAAPAIEPAIEEPSSEEPPGEPSPPVEPTPLLPVLGSMPATPPIGPRPDGRSPLVMLLALAIVAALAGTLFVFGPGRAPAASPSPPASVAAASVASTGPGSASPRSSSSATATASPAPSLGDRIAGGAIGGTWLSRVTLVPSGSADLTGQIPFQDRIVDIQPGCPTEPCPSATVRVFLVGDPGVVYQARLDRSGDTYRSAAVPAGTAPCLTKSGGQVPSGATVTRTISAWRERVTTPGTAVTQEQVRGEIRYDATPTKVGELAGCGPWSAIYLVSAEQPWSVPTLPPSPTPEPTPPPGSGLVTLPTLTFAVPGATVSYFPISGATAQALIDALPRAGVKACGEIQYDWYEGDPRPVGCVLPSANAAAISALVDPASGACHVAVTGAPFTYRVWLPQWTSPTFVPRPLLDWWRKVLVFIGTHESRHVAIFQQYAAMLPSRLAGASCDAAPGIVNAWATELEAAQSGFDKADYTKPWPMPPAGY